jgi:acetyltransferase-like isoleucine patch superfamily enzyme
VSVSGAPGRWVDGVLPSNVRLGIDTELLGAHSFRPFKSRLPCALEIGAGCRMEAVHFALGEDAHAVVGDHCYFSNALLLCEQEIRIGSFVMLGWNVAIADTDFHPIAPADRMADILALSPIGVGRVRPPHPRRPVVIDDAVWVGPNALILKGVHIGEGAFIEPGSVVTRDVPPRARVLGNPARVVGEV